MDNIVVNEGLKEKQKKRRKILLKKKLISFIARPLIRLFLIKKVIGKENIPKNGPIIFVSSHKKIPDPFYIRTVVTNKTKIEDYAIPAKKSLFKTKIGSYFIKLFDGIPTERDTHDSNVLFKLVRTIKSGGIVVIFPSATRVTDEEFEKLDACNEEQFKRGAFVLAKLKELPPVIPVDITYGKIRGTISFGRPIFYDANKYADDKLTGMTAEEKFCEDIKQEIINLRPKVITKKKH